MRPYEDPEHQFNHWRYHTGEVCIEGCGRQAGTYWSDLWCQQCNAKRMKKIEEFLHKALDLEDNDAVGGV